MKFLIADTFTDSLARLTGDEQKAVKTTAFDLQMDPSAPSMSFHKLDKAKELGVPVLTEAEFLAKVKASAAPSA